MSLLKRLKYLFSDWEYKQDQMLLSQRFSVMKTLYDSLPSSGKGAETEIRLKIDERMQEENWENLYAVEHLMIGLFDDALLSVTLSHNIEQARQHFGVENATLHERFNPDEASRAQKQAHLRFLKKELQQSFQVERQRREYIYLISLRTGLIFIGSFILFFLPDVFPGLAEMMLKTVKGEKSEYILTAIASGWMGASFSMLISLPRRIHSGFMDEMKSAARYSRLFARVFTGVAGGIILFYLFNANILESILSATILPVFNPTPPLMDNANQALLVVWCFLGGFSEKLVPHLLSKAEDQLRDRKEKSG